MDNKKARSLFSSSINITSTLLFLLTGISTGFPSSAVNSIRVTECPVIDGYMDDGVWSYQLPVTGEFILYRPDTGESMSEVTEIRSIYSDSDIYFHLTMHDSNMDECLATIGPRDGDFSSERVGIWLDTFNDDNNTYFFIVSISNVQSDGRISEIAGWDWNWDAVWESQTVLTDSCWMAEVRIPFSCLSYSDELQQHWGVNFNRTITRTNEGGFLFKMGDDGSVRVQDFGDLHGLESLPSGINIELRPYAAGRIRTSSQSGEDLDTWASTGIDARLNISSELHLDLTANPDFGQIEADPDEANLSHWELYLKEKRPFFQEGSELFNMPFNLFYSRRIGSVASDNTIIPILAGAKLTGSIEDFKVGFLDAYTAEVKTDTDVLEQPTNYFAGRVLRELSGGSFVSFFGTSADEYSDDDSSNTYGRSGGLDVQLRISEFHEISSAVAATWNSTDSVWKDNYAAQFMYYYDDDRLNYGINSVYKGDAFDANMIGYTSSTGAIESWVQAGYTLPLSSSQTFSQVWTSATYWYDEVPEGPITCRGASIRIGSVLQGGSDIWLALDQNGSYFDRFEGPDGSNYNGGSDVTLGLNTDIRRALYGSISIGKDSYFEGNNDYLQSSLSFQPLPKCRLQMDFDWFKVSDARRYNWTEDSWDSLDSDWRSIQLGAFWMFTTDLSIRITGQLTRYAWGYDGRGDSRSLDRWVNLLLSWQFRPGSMFYVLVGEDANSQYNGDFQPSEFTFYSKISWLF